MGKRWWRLVAILTFRSFGMPGERGENESNNPAALVPSNVSPGQLKTNSFTR